MNRYGDTPLGMVESALEFARIAREERLSRLHVLNEIEQPESDDRVRIGCSWRALRRKGQIGVIPIHLGVTEAGEGEDGADQERDWDRFAAARWSSAIRSGFRSPRIQHPREIPFAEETHRADGSSRVSAPTWTAKFRRRQSMILSRFKPARDTTRYRTCSPARKLRWRATFGWSKVLTTPEVYKALAHKHSSAAWRRTNRMAIYDELNVYEVDPTIDFKINCETQLVTVKDGVALPAITAFRLLAAKLHRLGLNNPILLKDCINFDPVPLSPDIALLRASVVIGALLADGMGDAILIRRESGAGQSLRLAFNILQAAGCRSFKTDYVACPSCGRTLFNLQTVTARIKERTQHLKGVKIAIMGCIVNGPGEMADADFGYVGGAPE